MKKASNASRNLLTALIVSFLFVTLFTFMPITAHAATNTTAIPKVTVKLSNSNKMYYAVPKVTIKGASYAKGNTSWNVKAAKLKKDKKVRNITARIYVIAKNGYKFTKKTKISVTGYGKKYTTATMQYVDSTQILVTLKTRSCIKKVTEPSPAAPTVDDTTNPDNTNTPDDGVINPYINPYANTTDPFYFIYYNGDWYYTNGRAYKTGWVVKDGKHYYMDPRTGKMLRNCVVEIDGKTYTFDENGVMIRIR